jgi:hypothetical protein
MYPAVSRLLLPDAWEQRHLHVRGTLAPARTAIAMVLAKSIGAADIWTSVAPAAPRLPQFTR